MMDAKYVVAPVLGLLLGFVGTVAGVFFYEWWQGASTWIIGPWQYRREEGKVLRERNPDWPPYDSDDPPNGSETGTHRPPDDAR